MSDDEGAASTDKLESKICPRCEKVLSLRANLRDHFRTASCARRFNSAKLEREGYAKVEGGHFSLRVIKQAGIPVRREQTGEALRRVPSMQDWAPRWAIEMLTDQWILIEGFREEEVLPLYAAALREANVDPDYRATLYAIRRLGGQRGFRNLVLGPPFRANKMREEGRAAAEKARRLFAEADVLDPREELPPCAVCVCRTLENRSEACAPAAPLPAMPPEVCP